MHMNGEIEIRHLRYFIAVAEELHFGRAALRLHLAQPPLSQQIRKLEDLLGHALFVRTSRAVKLTSAGEVLLDRARNTLKKVSEDVEDVRSVGRGEVGSLKVKLHRVGDADGATRDSGELPEAISEGRFATAGVPFGGRDSRAAGRVVRCGVSARWRTGGGVGSGDAFVGAICSGVAGEACSGQAQVIFRGAIAR